MLDLAIIGGGPAGLTAGLYATRGGLDNVVMFEMGMPGGQITQSSEIENYPGIKEVITGMELMQDWPEQCQRFGLKHEMSEVLQVVQRSDKTFTITLPGAKHVDALAVIIATGSIPKRAGFDGENEFFGRGVSTCATCDGFFYKGKEVAVLGGGDTALEEALYLANICSKVYLIHRRDTFRAAPSMIEKVKNSNKIELILNASIKEVKGDAMGVSSIDINTEDGIKTLDVPAIFVFVGRDVLNASLKQDDDSFLCATNDLGEIIVDLDMNTSIQGLFAAGDIRINAPKQVVCAAGDGATAALQAISYVEEVKG